MARKEEDGGKIKPVGFRHDYTPHQISELKRCAADPIYFIEAYCKVQHPKLGMVPFKLFDWQKELIRTYVANERVVALIGRQSGKSQTAAAFLLWWGIFNKDQHILIASNKGRNAKEIMTRIKFSYEELVWWIKPGIAVYNEMSIAFDNGTKIEAHTTTPSTGRGLSISLLYCLSGKEKVRVRNKITGEEREVTLAELHGLCQ